MDLKFKHFVDDIETTNEELGAVVKTSSILDSLSTLG